MQRLTRAKACLPPDPFGSVSAGGLLSTQATDGNQESGSSLPGFPALADDEEFEVLEEPDLEDFGGSDGDDKEDTLNLESWADFLVAEEVTPPSGFVVSVTRGGQCRRLPGEHFKKFDDFGQTVPPESAYTHRCKDCFPLGAVVQHVAEADAEMSESSGSSSSSSGTSLADEPTDS